MSPSKCTHAPPHRRQAEGLREAHTGLHDAEGRARELRKDPHKSLPRNLWLAVQGRTRGQEHWQRFQGQAGEWWQ